MIVRLFLAIFAAGVISGLLMTPAQYARIVPLILEAETYESGRVPGHNHAEAHRHADHRHTDAAALAADDQDIGGDHASGSAASGFARFIKTGLTNIAAGGGFALLLAGAALVTGIGFPMGREAIVRGLMLGAAGWFSVQLAPGWGLPPELPGFPYVDLVERQIWWAATAAMSAAGLYLIVLRPEWIARFAGMALIVAPHAYGAPQPVDMTSNVPALLASEFATAALATTLFFWLLLGALLGFFLSRVEYDGVPV